MKEVYQTSGNFNTETLQVRAYTYLPDIKGMNYNYIRYYNVSKGNEYGILGILVNDGLNEDLRNSTKPKKDHYVSQPIELETINNSYSDVDIESITDESELYFFCFHDDDFKTSYIVELMGSDTTLAEYLRSLRDYKHIHQPKKGNGGILTFDGN